jgi:beta-mannosidase
VLLRGKKTVALQPGESVKQQTLDLASQLEKHGRDSLHLRIALDVDGACVSEDTAFLTPPRFLALPKAKKTSVAIKLTSPKTALLTFKSPVFQHRFAFDFAELDYHAQDNFFELFPGEARTIAVTFTKPVTLVRLKKTLAHRSLADTY